MALAYDVHVVGDYAYVADGPDGLKIIDISDPTRPTKVGQYDVNDHAISVQIVGDYAYVAALNDGLKILDISNPMLPSLVGQFIGWYSASDVNVVGDYAYICDVNFKIIDISDPTNPVEIANFEEQYVYPSELQIVGDYAYLATGANGLVILDISNVSSPVRVGNCTDSLESPLGVLTGEANGIHVVGDFAYVADGFDGLEIFNISDPATPTEIGQFTKGGNIRGVYVVGNYAYIVDRGDGLNIIDISEPTNPKEVKQFTDRGKAKDVYVVGEYAFVIKRGLEIIKPWSPIEKTSNIILWGVIGFLSLLFLVDLRYIIKPIWYRKRKNFLTKIEQKQKKRKELIQEKKQKKFIKRQSERNEKEQQEKRAREHQKQIIIEQNRQKIEKIQKILKVSKKIRMEMMQDALEIPKTQFNKEIFDWADKFNFQIDGDFVIINQETVNDFISSLDSMFTDWSQKEVSKNNKKEK